MQNLAVELQESKVEIQERDVFHLLNKVYGFKLNKHNRKSNRRFVSWSWAHGRRLLVGHVISWSTCTVNVKHRAKCPFTATDIADSLGLDLDELAAAIRGEYEGSCLRFILVVHHAHCHLNIMSTFRRELGDDYELFIEAIGPNPRTNCVGLMRKHAQKVADLRQHPDTRQLGDGLFALMQ